MRCHSPERFRPVFSIVLFIYDTINCPTTWGEGGGEKGSKVSEIRHTRKFRMHIHVSSKQEFLDNMTNSLRHKAEVQNVER